MAKKSDDRATTGSGNVFADLGVKEPEEALAKARLVETIGDLLGNLALTQQEAGQLVGLTQPQISRLLRGDTMDFSYERLLRVLTALGQDINIRISRSKKPSGGRILVHH